MALTFNLPSQIVVQTAAQWAADNTVYSAKRILVTSDVYYGSTDQRKFKIADGVQTWSNLDYMPIEQVTTSTIGSAINGAASATPNDTDLVMSVESSVAKKNTWTQVKAFLKTYFDTVYTTTSAVASQITTALTGYATQAWVTSQGYITSVVTALGYTPENAANKSDSYTVSSSTTYATTKAIVDGLATKEPTISSGLTTQYYRGDKTFQILDKTAVGLSNVDNTSDANKPVSIAQQSALDLKLNITNALTYGQAKQIGRNF